VQHSPNYHLFWLILAAAVFFQFARHGKTGQIARAIWSERWFAIGVCWFLAWLVWPALAGAALLPLFAAIGLSFMLKGGR
jgi:hypothetical protein